MRVASLASACAILLLIACSTKEVDDGTSAASAGTGGEGGTIGCGDLCRLDHPEGAELFDDLGLCLLCRECYVDCEGSTAGCSEPTRPGLCDGKTVCEDNDSDPSDDCASCALNGPCAEELEACQGSADCVEFLQCLQPC